jgi:hypothetical protein
MKIKISLGGNNIMGRSNNQKSSSRKNSLPQTPENLKIEPDRVNEEFSRELGESEKIRPTRPK